LNPCRVYRLSHQSAERVDLSYQVAFRGPADGGVARHVRDSAFGKRTKPNPAAKTRSNPRRFRAGVTSAHHHYIVRTHAEAIIDYQKR
jgi:hypothetical protein